MNQLKELGIGIIFQKENIDTLDAKGEVPKCYVEESHPDIIEKDMWEAV